MAEPTVLVLLVSVPLPVEAAPPTPLGLDVRRHLVERTAAAAAGAGLTTVAVVDEGTDPSLAVDMERWEVVGDDPSERIGAAVAAASGPVLLVRPFVDEVTAAHLTDAVGSLGGPWGDAVVGLTVDERWWLLGLQRPDPMAVLGLPLEGSGVGAHLLDRLHGLGLALGVTDRLREVASMEDLREVASERPDGPLAARFGAGGPT